MQLKCHDCRWLKGWKTLWKPLTPIGFQSFDPLEWPASNFSLQYHSCITNQGHENKESEYQPKKLLIIKQISLVNTMDLYVVQYREYVINVWV